MPDPLSPRSEGQPGPTGQSGAPGPSGAPDTPRPSGGSGDARVSGQPVTSGHSGSPGQSSSPGQPHASGQAEGKRRLRPAALLFEPAEEEAGPEHFFDLESMDDPRELLERSTELVLAFRAAAERATEFQAVAAARLADPRRFDRLPLEHIAEHADWTTDYAKKMVEFGRDLIRDGHSRD